MYIHRSLVEQSWYENDSVPLPIWGHCVEQDSLHYWLNGFSPNPVPLRKPLASLQAYLSYRQHTWTFYVGRKNSNKMLSTGRGFELLSFPGLCIPALLLLLCTYRCQAPLSGLSCCCPFFYNAKKHNKVTKRTWLWVLLYQILGYREHQISTFWGFEWVMILIFIYFVLY